LNAAFRIHFFAKNYKSMDTDINKVFGRRVAELRRKQFLSQEEFAFKCSLHRTYIGAIERGEKSPTLNTIERIAKGLNVTIAELFIQLYDESQAYTHSW